MHKLNCYKFENKKTKSSRIKVQELNHYFYENLKTKNNFQWS